MSYKKKLNNLNKKFNQINISIIYKLFIISIFLLPASNHLPALIFGSHKIAKIQHLEKIKLSSENIHNKNYYEYRLEYYNNDILKIIYFNTTAKFKHNEIVDIKVLNSEFVILDFVFIYLTSFKLAISLILITIVSAIYFSFLKV